MATRKGLPTIWQGPRCRSERAYLAHGQPRPSTRCAGPPLRSGPAGDCRARPCGMLLRASQKAGPPSTRRSAAHGKPLSCRGEPLQQTRETGRTNPPRTPGPNARSYPLRIASCGCAPDTVRIETGAVTEHRAGDVQQAVGHRAQSAGVAMTAGSQRPVLVVADRIVLGGNAGPSGRRRRAAGCGLPGAASRSCSSPERRVTGATPQRQRSAS